MKKILIAVAAVTLVAALYAGPASAHVTVVKRFPGKGATASTSITRAWVKFNTAIRSGTLKVYKRSNGVKVSIGTGTRDPRNFRRIITRLKSDLRAGGYVARWTCVAADGHSQSGSWRFRLVN
jgi:methionine-rich copper-binding protein CopC